MKVLYTFSSSAWLLLPSTEKRAWSSLATRGYIKGRTAVFLSRNMRHGFLLTSFNQVEIMHVTEFTYTADQTKKTSIFWRKAKIMISNFPRSWHVYVTNFLEVFVLELAQIFVATVVNELVNLTTYHIKKYPSLTFNTSWQFVMNICT